MLALGRSQKQMPWLKCRDCRGIRADWVSVQMRRGSCVTLESVVIRSASVVRLFVGVAAIEGEALTFLGRPLGRHPIV